MRSSNAFLSLTLILALLGTTTAFAPSPIIKSNQVGGSSNSILTSPPMLPTFASSSSAKLHQAGRNDDPDLENVNVNEIANVDATTLTAVGFGLIAFNFFVLGNMGDAGIGGLVATIINSI
eukprot:CAMPEP_0197246332 /NCGR_PEP_ID=MMETSP1429-20130617/10811_1 /TAXON_ID=49237 /ORGANISM="Chaetoceros  sp., Strain UNC1202" /LENGTH=120 /DNA_ID=CAMNT_0042706953 /DNA_START=54 /DNA_END=416 /DNA_ORIENTATION=+